MSTEGSVVSYLEEAIKHRSSARQLRELAEELDVQRSYDASRIALARAIKEEQLAVDCDYRARMSDEQRTVQMNELVIPMSRARDAS